MLAPDANQDGEDELLYGTQVSILVLLSTS
jgi:hypothetical protein